MSKLSGLHGNRLIQLKILGVLDGYNTGFDTGRENKAKREKSSGK